MEKLNYFCNHIRAALACYLDMTPEQKARARMYASRKLRDLDALHTAEEGPGGELAGELLQKMHKPSSSQENRA